MTTFEDFFKNAKNIKPDRESLSPELLEALDHEIEESRLLDAQRVANGLPSQLYLDEVDTESKP